MISLINGKWLSLSRCRISGGLTTPKTVLGRSLQDWLQTQLKYRGWVPTAELTFPMKIRDQSAKILIFCTFFFPNSSGFRSTPRVVRPELCKPRHRCDPGVCVRLGADSADSGRGARHCVGRSRADENAHRSCRWRQEGAGKSWEGGDPASVNATADYLTRLMILCSLSTDCYRGNREHPYCCLSHKRTKVWVFVSGKSCGSI